MPKRRSNVVVLFCCRNGGMAEMSEKVIRYESHVHNVFGLKESRIVVKNLQRQEQHFRIRACRACDTLNGCDSKTLPALMVVCIRM